MVKEPKLTKPRFWMYGERLVVEIANSCILSLSIANSVIRFTVMWGRFQREKQQGGEGEV